jgi:hypothetical protein
MAIAVPDPKCRDSREKTVSAKIMARDFDDEWLQESSDGSGAVYLAVLCAFFAFSAVRPSNRNRKVRKGRRKVTQRSGVPRTKLDQHQSDTLIA